MSLPARIHLSKKVTDKFRMIKANTGVSPNILCRIAISLSLESETSIVNAGVTDNDGQELNRDVLFGDLSQVYEGLIKQFVFNNNIESELRDVIVSLIEMGAHKMAHIKKVDELLKLGVLSNWE